MSSSWTRAFTAVALVSVLFAQPMAVLADVTTSDLTGVDQPRPKSVFDPNSVLDDSDMFEIGAMTLDDVQSFLSAKGTLGRLRVVDIDGVEKRASDIIWRVATSYKISP